MTILRDTRGAGHFILSEAQGWRSRQRIKIGASQTLLAGALIAAIGLGVSTATPAASSGPGNGAVGVWTVDAGAPGGRWVIRLLGSGPTAAYEVRRPDGSLDGQGAVGTAYNGGINGTLADGSVDWGAGAEIPVVVSYADGDVFVAYDPTGVNGSQHLGGILFDAAITVAGETVDAVGLVRDCEVSEYAIPWGALTDPQKAAAIATLARQGVLVRH